MFVVSNPAHGGRIKMCGVADMFDLACGACVKGSWMETGLYIGVVEEVRHDEGCKGKQVRMHKSLSLAMGGGAEVRGDRRI